MYSYASLPMRGRHWTQLELDIALSDNTIPRVALWEGCVEQWMGGLGVHCGVWAVQ
jgi:hypothetical protein